MCLRVLGKFASERRSERKFARVCVHSCVRDFGRVSVCLCMRVSVCVWDFRLCSCVSVSARVLVHVCAVHALVRARVCQSACGVADFS